MVEVVRAVSGQSSTPRLGSQGAAASITSEPAQNASAELVSSHIRVDNLQNVAILEYRSSQTGEVIRQYPTQSQIDAFRRAERISQQQQTVSPPSDSGGAADTPAPSPPSGGDSTTSILA